MSFSIRDLFWATATIALTATLLVTYRQHAAFARSLNKQIVEAEKQSAAYMNDLKKAEQDRRRLAARSREIQDHQYQEILSLQRLLEQSLGDQREWFELQVEGNRIIAIGPATSDSVEVTPRVLDFAERRTGLDGSRLRHFLTPISQLELGGRRRTGR